MLELWDNPTKPGIHRDHRVGRRERGGAGATSLVPRPDHDQNLDLRTEKSDFVKNQNFIPDGFLVSPGILRTRKRSFGSLWLGILN